MTNYSTFYKDLLSHKDCGVLKEMLNRMRRPDLVLAPLGVPYLYRWCLIPRNDVANVYVHVQVGDDDGRDMHDHPYDNTSVILSGGYDEHLVDGTIEYAERRWPRSVIHRPAAMRHRLTMRPSMQPYSMSLFTTGPRVREWGFYTPQGWVQHDALIRTANGVSTQRAA